ncbi:MAG: tRNA (guanosine(37)-N1)-methyltransferase TrmD [Candidatus Latescibacterota bacterium]|jgi:tRNA (guanine37-N1)-methyltransferase|nr:MAG: tRNA (guanosine(37)-N1)-methyltransferase TrmD [Candidatus Latescibacterota bacterium]
MDIYFITIFPDMFREALAAGMTGIAERNGAVRYHVVNLRDFAEDRYGSVDDYPYGGGPGMILMAPPLVRAVESVRPAAGAGDAPVILLSPCGAVFTQAKAHELAGKSSLVFICGRYKGVDERVRDLVVTESLSIGDYILSGGELAALVVTDAVVRCLPNVIGDERSRDTDSFSAEREFSLDAAYYTRPPEFRGLAVPETLLSGNHARIAEWRERSARERTERCRPDLLAKARTKGIDD